MYNTKSVKEQKVPGMSVDIKCQGCQCSGEKVLMVSEDKRCQTCQSLKGFKGVRGQKAPRSPWSKAQKVYLGTGFFQELFPEGA